ncbi:MAG TPA: UDP-N-acetylglucosamine 2-epimerase [Candidatus Nitrosocosmicus sp.]
MRDKFIDKLNFKPNHDLKSNTSNVLTITNLMHSHIKKISPDYVIVYGDTSSSMAAANVAENIKSKIIHLEAGVQDYDYNVPEELLRIKIDEMADYLFAHLIFVNVICHMNK